MRLFVLAAFVTGCAPTYDYVPTRQALLEDAPGEIDGHKAAGYDAPDGVPGEVKVAVVGVERLDHAAVLHARMIVRNDTDDIWSVDAGRQDGVLANVAHRPLRASFDGAEVPLAVVMPHETRTADLYYELADPRSVAGFRLDWRVDTPGRVIAARQTPFERHLRPHQPLQASPVLSARRGERDDPFHDGLSRSLQ